MCIALRKNTNTNKEALVQTAESNIVEKTRSYYDSDDANTFYHLIWGGEDIHIGLYDEDTTSIGEASRKTVAYMSKLIPHLGNHSKVLDLGAGFGGSARFLAEKKGCEVTCLNLSEEQNKINRENNKSRSLETSVSVKTGNFEDIPYKDGTFDVVWSQDAFLHSGNREKVLREAHRVLRPLGTLIFTDPMQDESARPEALTPVLKRIHLDSLATVSSYRNLARKVGFTEYLFNDQTANLTTHYARVLVELALKHKNLQGKCSEEYIEKMKQGLKYWVDAGKSRDLRWGVFRFTKPFLQK
jgi:sarcosine/dimethylglycine N-methyltransferase